MNKVFLDNLPRYEQSNQKGRINWSNSIGHKVKFIYNNIEGYVTIKEYNKQTHCLWIQYLSNSIYKTRTSNFIYCQLGELLGIYSNEFKYELGKEFKDNKRNITITDKFYNEKNQKWYKYKCNKCGWDEGSMNEPNLTTGNGCPVCCTPSKKIIRGINDIHTTHLYMVKYFLDINDSYLYSYGSDKYILTKCPDCKNIRKMKISDLYVNGFSCKKCGDGISYPEKFMFSILEQLNINFETQKIFEWALKNKYDYYFKIETYTFLIETHGRQHYEKSFSTCGGRNIKEEQENDTLKEKLAKVNNISHYIVIDCRKSDKEWIKNSIINSQFSKLFDLSIIDWDECDKFASSNRIKDACILWNNGIHSTKEIAGLMKLAYQTIVKYLKKGVEFNWCDYDPKETLRLGRIKNSGHKEKIICITTGEIFDSQKEAGNKYNIFPSGISNCCRNIRKYCGIHSETGEKMIWMYYDEYLKQKEVYNIGKAEN